MDYDLAFEVEPVVPVTRWQTITRLPGQRLPSSARRYVRAYRWPRVVPAAPIVLSMESFEYDPEMEYFLGGLVQSVGRAVSNVGRAVGRAANTVGRIPIVRDAVRTVSKVARVVDRAAQTVGRIPVVGDIARAGVGAARLSLGPAAIAIDAAHRVARGENLGKAIGGAVSSHVDAVRDQLKLAEMVAPFIPGVGTGVAAALGAANALASGRPITEALISAARSALPGGAIAQAAFDTAINLAKGKDIGQALLEAARDRLPGGPAARAAFDSAVALAQGKKLQDVAFAAAGRILPPSPFAADALAFVKQVANGQNIQHAALSVAGQHAVRQIENRAGVIKRELELELAAGLNLNEALNETPIPRHVKTGPYIGSTPGDRRIGAGRGESTKAGRSPIWAMQRAVGPTVPTAFGHA
jgi:hypothetical protein